MFFRRIDLSLAVSWYPYMPIHLRSWGRRSWERIARTAPSPSRMRCRHCRRATWTSDTETERPLTSLDRGAQTVEPAPRFAAAVSEPVVPPALPSQPPTPALTSVASDDRTVPVASKPTPVTETPAKELEPTPDEPSASTLAETTLTAPLPRAEPDLLARLTPLPHAVDPGLPAKLDERLAPTYPDTGMQPTPIVGGSPADGHGDASQADAPRFALARADGPVGEPARLTTYPRTSHSTARNDPPGQRSGGGGGTNGTSVL